jgi:hypothetical protein
MELFILIFYIVLFGFAFYNVQNAVFLYVLFIPFRDFTEIMFMGLFGLNDLFIIILLLHFIRLHYIESMFKRNYVQIKPLIWFFLTVITIVFMNTIRLDSILQDYSQREMGGVYYIKKTAMFALELVTLFILINIVLRFSNFRRITFISMIYSMIILVLSVYFAQYLSTIGINIRTDAEEVGDLTRNAGIFGGGDVNSLSTLLNLGISMVLINSFFNKRNLKLKEMAFILVFSIGVLLSGSRMAIVTFVLIISYYLLFLQISQRKKQTFLSVNLIYLIAALILVYYFLPFDERFYLVFLRIQDVGLTNEVSESGHRFIRWIAYLNFIFSDTNRILFGTNDIFYAFGGRKFVDAHNFFIMTMYSNGIIGLLIFLFSFFKLLKLVIRQNLIRPFILMFIVILISLMIISQTIFLYYFIFFMAILLYSNDKSNVENEYTMISKHKN